MTRHDRAEDFPRKHGFKTGDGEEEYASDKGAKLIGKVTCLFFLVIGPFHLGIR